jgi:hypothetical protein
MDYDIYILTVQVRMMFLRLTVSIHRGRPGGMLELHVRSKATAGDAYRTAEATGIRLWH